MRLITESYKVVKNPEVVNDHLKQSKKNILIEIFVIAMGRSKSLNENQVRPISENC